MLRIFKKFDIFKNNYLGSCSCSVSSAGACVANLGINRGLVVVFSVGASLVPRKRLKNLRLPLNLNLLRSVVVVVSVVVVLVLVVCVVVGVTVVVD